MKDGVGLPSLAEKVVLGRIAQGVLEENFPRSLPEETFSVFDTVEDEFVDTDAIINSNLTSEDDCEKLRKLIAEGLASQKKLYCLQTFLLTTMHPDPPSDATADVRDNSTLFQFGLEPAFFLCFLRSHVIWIGNTTVVLVLVSLSCIEKLAIVLLLLFRGHLH